MSAPNKQKMKSRANKNKIVWRNQCATKIIDYKDEKKRYYLYEGTKKLFRNGTGSQRLTT